MPTVEINISGGSQPTLGGGIRLPDMNMSLASLLGQMGGNVETVTVAANTQTSVAVPTDAKFMFVLLPSDAKDFNFGGGAANGVECMGTTNLIGESFIAMPVAGGNIVFDNDDATNAFEVDIYWF